MARLSIYVTDELKARMDEVGDDVNWSEVVRPAIQAAVATSEHRRKPDMSTAIERLRASRREFEEEESAQGRADGRQWAEDDADYRELSRIAEIDEDRGNWPRSAKDSWYRCLWQAIDPEMSEGDFMQYLFGEITEKPSNEYCAGFAEGARKFFEEVRHKL